MPEPVTVPIGGQDVSVPPIMNFSTLERVWPALKGFSTETDPIAQVSYAVAIISGAVIATRPDLTVAAIKDRLRVNLADGTDERGGIVRAADALCLASGLVRLGEAKPAATPASGTTDPTGNTSSQS